MSWTLAGILWANLNAFVPCRAETVNDSGQWFALFANGDLQHDALGDDWKWWFDGQVRFFDDTDGFGQSLVRPGIGYNVTDNATLWAGYAWIRTSPEAAEDFDEHRAWQQLTWSEQLHATKFDLRSRLEERFVETGADTGWRFRQLAAARRPLPGDSRFTFVLWDEVFFHLNDTDWGADAGFDQNRAFVGLGWKPDSDSTWRVEVGYLHQFIDRPTNDDLSNHLLSVNFFYSP
jgi:Protein of unknown function (DUF2490)